MNPALQSGNGRSVAGQPMAAAEAPTMAANGPHLNALKHGLRSAALLLPGEDAAEFQRQRCALFHNYQPVTEDEAECVELMAQMRWLMRRCIAWQARVDKEMSALCDGPVEQLPEPDAHKRLHGTTDCMKHWQRLQRMLCKERSALWEMQRMRRLHLIPQAGQPASYLEFMERGQASRLAPDVQPEQQSPAVESSPPVDAGAPEHPPILPVRHSSNGENGKSSERKPETGLPWAEALPVMPLGAYPSLSVCSSGGWTASEVPRHAAAR